MLLNQDSSAGDTLAVSSSHQYTKRTNTAEETREQAIQRHEQEKELKRLEKLMRYAYPRQREDYLYRKKLLTPAAFNMSVDLLKLKKESMRLDQEKETLQNSIMIQEASNVAYHRFWNSGQSSDALNSSATLQNF